MEDAAGETLAHVQRPVAKIAEFIGQLGVIEHHQAVHVIVRILAGDDVAHQVVADCLHAEFLSQLVGVHDVTGRFGHLRSAEAVPEAVDQQPRHPGVREADGMQHAQPVNAVRWDQDVLADDMHRPS